MTPEQTKQALVGAAISLASEPKVKHFSPDTITLVLKQTVMAYAGAGSEENALRRLSEDPALADVPPEVVTAIFGPALAHFATALVKATS